MSQVTVTAPEGSPLAAARTACAHAIVRGYGATREYAGVMNAELGSDWVTREDDPEVKAEKSAFYAELKAGGHSNPSVVWARLKKESVKLAAAAEAGESEGEGEGEEGEGSGAKHPRSLQLRMIEELTRLHKAIGRAESLTPGQRSAAECIKAALKALGVDTATL